MTPPPYLAILYFLFTIAACSVMLALGSEFILSGKPANQTLRFGTLLAMVPATVGSAFLLFLSIAIVVRNPRLVTRSIVLADNTVLMPRRKDGRILISDVAGVGLALQQGASGRGGTWGLMIWRADGSHAWIGGFQRKHDLEHPETAKVGIAARVVYSYVLDRQGPDGPLRRQAMQRYPQFSLFVVHEVLGSRRRWTRQVGAARTDVGVTTATTAAATQSEPHTVRNRDFATLGATWS